MTAIIKKELHAYFTGVIGWIFLAAILLITGLFHWVYNFNYSLASFSYSLSSCMLYVVLLIPLFTMRSMAEEAHQKTDQLLYTAPVSITKIVLGKYLAMVIVFAIATAILALYPLTMSFYGTVDFGEDYLTIGMFFLMGCCYIAIGLFISSLVENQILAAVFTEIVFVFSIFSSSIGSFLPTDNLTALLVLSALVVLAALIIWNLTKNPTFAGIFFLVCEAALVVIYFVKASLYDGILVKVFDSLSVIDHISDAINAIFNLTDAIYFVTVSILFIFLTVQSVNKKRWG